MLKCIPFFLILLLIHNTTYAITLFPAVEDIFRTQNRFDLRIEFEETSPDEQKITTTIRKDRKIIIRNGEIGLRLLLNLKKTGTLE
jgi:hypothetical protein